MRSAVKGFLASLVVLASLGGAWAQDTPKRAITQLAGDLYRFQNNFHYSVFLVTPDGIIATDPISADAAAWLKAELAARFKVPVRYLIYSHDHADHIAGGEVFADTAAVIAHANAAAHIAGEARPTATPDITFTDRMTITLGGKQVDLIYLGKNHSDNSIVMHFPAERAVFAVDFVAVNRLPYRNLPNSHVEDWIDTLEKLEAMDFDILAPGHGAVGTRADVAPQRRYLEELRAEVLTRVRQGMPLEQIQAEVKMPAYASWGSYADWIALNVEGMHRHLMNHRRGN
jgi:glyoxylase-like metal-dependent hydrolase (beta-lactamase superfamily II)